MKTKEIEVWLREDELNFNGISCQTNRHDKWQIKAKLIIEIPEKKIEITESEFDMAIERAKTGEGCIGFTVNDIKRELGFNAT